MSSSPSIDEYTLSSTSYQDITSWRATLQSQRDDLIEIEESAAQEYQTQQQSSITSTPAEVFTMAFQEELTKMEKLMLVDEIGTNLSTAAKKVRSQKYLAELVLDSIETFAGQDSLESQLLAEQWDHLVKEKARKTAQASDAKSEMVDEFSFQFNSF